MLSGAVWLGHWRASDRVADDHEQKKDRDSGGDARSTTWVMRRSRPARDLTVP